MSTWLVITSWIAAHHAYAVEAAGGALFVINLMLKLMPLQNWVALAERSPRIAALVRLLGGLGIQPITVLQAFIDFLRGHTSPGGAAEARAFQISASKPLIAPKTLTAKDSVCQTCGKVLVVANDNATRDTPKDPFKKP